MMKELPTNLLKKIFNIAHRLHFFTLQFTLKEKTFLSFLTLALITTIFLAHSTQPIKKTAQLAFSPQLDLSQQPLKPLAQAKDSQEVFGFAPYWTIDKLDGVDFDTLTTLAYFSVPVGADGNLIKSDYGYQVFSGSKATDLFRRAHQSGTRVVLTLTQMSGGPILALLDNPDAQANAISQSVDEVQKRGIDGINIDLEYSGNPGQGYRDKFSKFVGDLTNEMHRQNPNSKVTVSVYAASVHEPKIYDIAKLASASDGIFMMAYDFAVAGSANAIPTAPLHGYKEGKYWYDVSTAVDDFLTQMPADKLILGVPWYGYNYAVSQPEVKSPTYRYHGQSQTYEVASNNIHPEMPGISAFQAGWDELGQVGWKAYYALSTGAWRMIFLDDSKSLGLKYDLAKDKKLAGVGIWALGFDGGKGDFWSLLREKFGPKFADAGVVARPINEMN